MKRLLSFYLLVSVIVLCPHSIPAVETTPHTIPWIKHKATINPSGNVHSLEFGPEGTYLGIELNTKYLIYDLASHKFITTIDPNYRRHFGWVNFDGLVIGPDSEKIYIAGGYDVPGVFGTNSQGWIQVHDLQTGKKLKEIAHHDWDLNNLEDGPNRRFLVSTDHVDQALIYDTKKNHYLPIFDPGTGNLWGGDLHYPDPSVLILLTDPGTPVYTIDPSPDKFSFSDYLPHSTFLGFLAPTYRKKIVLNSTGDPQYISPNGKYIMGGDVDIFDLRTGELVHKFSRPSFYPDEIPWRDRDNEFLMEGINISESMAWGSESKWIANGGYKGLIHFRRLGSSQIFLTFRAGTKRIDQMVFGANNQSFVTSVHRGNIKIWSFDPPAKNPIQKTLNMQDTLKN